MVIHGNTWLYMGIHGNTWHYMAIHGNIWQYMVIQAIHGNTWLYMGIHGNRWLYMAIHSYTWLYMGIHGNTWLGMECITIVRGTHRGPLTMLHYLLEWKISGVRRIQNCIRLFHLSIIVQGYFLTVCSVIFRLSCDMCSTIPVPIACPILFISLMLTLIKVFFNFLFPSVVPCISQVIAELHAWAEPHC